MPRRTGRHRYDDLMAVARSVNDQRDAMEHASGWAAPGDAGAAPLLRVAMSAIKAGIVTEDWSCVAEGQAMLEQLGRILGA